MKYLLVLLTAFLFTIHTAMADDSLHVQITGIDSAFSIGHYEQVELLTLRLLRNTTDIPNSDLAHIHVVIASSLIMLNRESEARDYFHRALDADPDLTLDPAEVSPKFRVVFDDVKLSYQRKKTVHQNSMLAETRASRESQVLNLFIPGFGLWREGVKIRGAAFFVLEAASLGFLFHQLNETQNSREIYLAETDPQQISKTYDDYNRNHNLVWVAGAATAAIYLGAQLDLIFLRKPVTLTLLPSSSTSLLLTLNF